MKGIILLIVFLTGLAPLGCDSHLDVEFPSIEIISPEEGVPYIASLPLKLKVSDNDEVDRIEVFLDDQLLYVFTTEPFVTEVDICGFEEKPMMIRAMVHDRGGNTAEAQLSIIHAYGVKITSPNGGEVWPERSTQTITWEQCGVAADYVNLFYSSDEGTSWTQIVISTANDGSYLWTLPDIPETQTTYRVKASSIDGGYSAVSDDNFTITQWSPRLVGSCDTPGFPLGIFVSKSYAYVTEGYGGLQIFNISNPATPAHVGSHITPGDRTWGVFVLGSYAYVTDGQLGVYVLSISNPNSPTLVGSYDADDNAFDVFVSGSFAYLADGQAGLKILDISDPVHPTLVGSYDTPGIAFGVFVSGSYAYVADGQAGLHIINISEPAEPIGVAIYDTPGTANEVFLSGSYAYLADGNAGLQIVNAHNPAIPELVSSYDTPSYAYGIFVAGSAAYVANGYAGLQVIDIGNPENPTLAGFIKTFDARDVFVVGNYAYIAEHPKKFLVVDVSGLP